MKIEIISESELATVTDALTESSREGMERIVRAILNPPTEENHKNGPPIKNMVTLYVDRTTMLPLGIFEWSVLGTREEIARLLQANHDGFLNSFELRKNQNKAFVILKEKYGMKDSEILDLLIPSASRDERDKVYNRLKRHYARVKAAKKGTKT
jgi:hypothetical protein